MKAVVLGSGGWGTALAQVLCDNGHDVTLWSRTAAKAAVLRGPGGKGRAAGHRLVIGSFPIGELYKSGPFRKEGPLCARFLYICKRKKLQEIS